MSSGMLANLLRMKFTFKYPKNYILGASLEYF